jgi:hypothetical protein
VKFLSVLFRVDEWRRCPEDVRYPHIAFLVVLFATAIVLIQIGRPESPWRDGIAVVLALVSSEVVRFVVRRRMRGAERREQGS